ncbi:hypothetical protein RIF29_34689 [Crotalaria pallida]|uniref:Uncharacterized protein n=1 Tax=Crotalaria pallida TaxID=3830 RepID=A0AAN9E950_CROPI
MEGTTNMDKAETNRGSGPFIYAGLFSPIREEPLPYSSPVRKRYRSYDEQVSSGNPQFGTALYDFPIALDDKLPDLHHLMVEAAKILNADPPDLYVRQSPVPNAYTLAALCIGDKFTFVRWDPVHKDAVKKLFHSRASARLSDIFNDASKKKKKKRPSVITEELWPQLWQTSLTKFNHPDHLEKQEKSKQNRASSKGGSVHTGGSVNHAQYAQDMVRFLTLRRI